MALITPDSFNRITKDRNTIHDPVDATYTVFNKDGKKYFQIDTYGRVSRKYTDKISQSLQLDEKAAAALVDLLNKEMLD